MIRKKTTQFFQFFLAFDEQDLCLPVVVKYLPINQRPKNADFYGPIRGAYKVHSVPTFFKGRSLLDYRQAYISH